MWLILAAALAFAADDSPNVIRARQELDRVREQVSQGLLPAARIDEAQRGVDDAADEDTLNRTLYAHLAVEDLNESQANEMVAAAQRRVYRVEEKLKRDKDLIATGIAPVHGFDDVNDELARRQKELTEAQSRAELVNQIVAIARAEVEAVPEAAVANRLPEEHVDGERDRLLESKDIKEITLAFEKQFHEPFPISARGATAVHRAMGFDHTGRIDVAVTPDSREGQWLRKYLEAKSIPYYAFRVAMPGKATAAHIHIGPGSTRIHVTD